MKSYNLISLVIAMLFCVTAYSQQDTISRNGPSKPVLIRLGRPANENNQPLYILDGKIISEKEFQNLKSETIESVNVLKDSAAISTYGLKGKYGVIIIKTKKTSKKQLRELKKKDS